jgi:hypothetical protein
MSFLILDLKDPKHVKIITNDNGETLWLEKPESAREISENCEFTVIIDMGM